MKKSLQNIKVFFMRLAAQILSEAFKRVDKYLEETNITREELLLLSEAERKLRFKNYVNNASVAPDNLNQIIVKQVALVNWHTLPEFNI